MAGRPNRARILVELIADGLAATPDLNVVTFIDTTIEGELVEEVRSYRQLWSAGAALADGLAFEGMRRGDAFGLLMMNHPEFVEAMVGASFAGAVYVPVDGRLTGDRLVHMLGFSECRGVIVADYALSALIEVLPRLQSVEWIWVVGRSSGITSTKVRLSAYGDVLASGCVERAPLSLDPASPMQMLFTSGTTGAPKAILSPHARFAFAASLGEQIGLQPGDRPYTGLSLTHANGQLMTLGNALAMGMPAVIGRRFTKSRLWEVLAHYKCTTFNLLGGMATAIHAQPPGPGDRAHNVRFVLSAGMPASLWIEFSRRFGVDIFEFFGTAEGGLTLNPPRTGPVGSIGKAPAGTVCAVLDENGRVCRAGELGELCFRGTSEPADPVTYYKDPVASAAKVREGWFRSGDVGYTDQEGWCYFAHRTGGGLRRNGAFINPRDIEMVIATMPGVTDVYVYGVTTIQNAPGECEIVAAITSSEGVTFNAGEVFNYCGGRLSGNATPSFVQLVGEIPKTASEKPQDRFLIEKLEIGASPVFDRSGPTRISLIKEQAGATTSSKEA